MALREQVDGKEIAFFEMLGPRKAQTIAIASVALRGWLTRPHMTDVRVALGAVAPTVMSAPRRSNGAYAPDGWSCPRGSDLTSRPR